MNSFSLVDYVYKVLLEPKDQLLNRCIRQAYQGSGAGGQKRNRVYSGIRLIDKSAQVSGSSCEFREAKKNLNKAILNLRMNLALAAFEELQNTLEGESYSSQLLDKVKSWDWAHYPKIRFPIHSDHFEFPLLTFQALVLIKLYQGEIRPLANFFNCSSSKVIKFLKADKTTLQRVQTFRELLGLHKIK